MSLGEQSSVVFRRETEERSYNLGGLQRLCVRHNVVPQKRRPCFREMRQPLDELRGPAFSAGGRVGRAGRVTVSFAGGPRAVSEGLFVEQGPSKGVVPSAEGLFVGQGPSKGVVPCAGAGQPGDGPRTWADG